MVLNNTSSIVEVYYTKSSLGLEISFLAVAVIAVAAIIFLVLPLRKHFMADSMDLSFDAKLLKCTYHLERNYENLEIAHRIYTELVTRKAAIPIEPEHDVIKEVYDSWYALFNVTREEIKNLSGKSLKTDHCDELVSMSIDILNKGLRPHLTAYQAKFRKWYSLELEKPENMYKSPQQIQQSYPMYNELIQSMQEVNELLISYSANLKQFINKAK